MIQRRAFSLSSSFFFQLALGFFFLMLGIMGLDGHNSRLSELARAFGRNDTLSLIMSLVEMAMGIVLILRLFFDVPSGISSIIAIVLFCLWAFYMFMSLVANDTFLKPNFVVWLYNVSWHTIILIGLWQVGALSRR